MRSQRGAGTLGCIFSLILVVGVGFVGFRVMPVYLDKVNFEDDLSRIVSRAGAGAWTDPMIERQIFELGKAREFRVDSERLRITRVNTLQGTPELRVEVNFGRTVDFPGYSHTFSFQTRAETFIGRF